MRSLLLIAIYIIFSFLSPQLQSQTKEWNLILEKETYVYRTNKVLETDSFYYVAGRSGNVNYGFSVTKVNKRNGTTVASCHYEEMDVNMDFQFTQEWYLEGDKLLFPTVTWNLPAYINLFSVDMHTLEIEKIAAIPVPDERSKNRMYLYDMKKIERDYYILAAYLIGDFWDIDSEVYPFLIRYSPTTKEYKVIQLGDGNDKYGLHKMIGLNGHIYVFASEPNKNYIGEAKQVIYCLNPDGEQIRKHITPRVSPIYDVCDVYPLNDREVLLASRDIRFSYADHYSWPRWTVTRYDLEANKEIWSTYWDEPRKQSASEFARIVPTKMAGEYLLMANDEVSTDTEDYSKGKVVRFTDDGKRLWQKTYYYNNSKWGLINDFYSMIPTSDGNYLIVGYVNWGGGLPWLVKIDDDGNIVPVDTTTSVQDILIDIEEAKNVKVIPNPWNNETQIKFYLPAEGNVALRVTDVTGKVVFTHREFFRQGENTLRISADDITVPGMLMYELKFGNQTKLGKMLNIR